MTGASAVGPTPSGRRVVVADNDPDALELVVTDLMAAGNDVVGASTSSSETIELCLEVRPDVLVVDYRMPPGPDGVAVAEQVLAAIPEMLVIVYSNYRDADVQARARRAGAKFLSKGNIRALRRMVASS